MSKRNRTSRRPQSRPGARPSRPGARPGPASASFEPGSAATTTTTSGTAALVAAAPNPASAMAAPPAAQRRSNARPSSLLARKAEDEYVYVAQDIRHIGLILAVVLVIFVALWVLIEVAHVITY